MKKGKRLLLLIAIPILGILALWQSPFFQRQLAIDRCLDSGGRYDEKRNSCLQVEPASGSAPFSRR